ncbi:MAG: hypothetical protein SFX19_04380 [Alphaproteobacteria bacterium]|nr:hypothetical protein [Alphaproteobacteria bacterium]
MEHFLRLACLAGISHHILKNIVIRRHGLEYLLHLRHDLFFAYPEFFGWVFRIPAHEVGIFRCAAITVGFNLSVRRHHLAGGGAGKQPTEHVILLTIRKGLFVPAHPHGGAGIV